MSLWKFALAALAFLAVSYAQDAENVVIEDAFSQEVDEEEISAFDEEDLKRYSTDNVEQDYNEQNIDPEEMMRMKERQMKLISYLQETLHGECLDQLQLALEVGVTADENPISDECNAVIQQHVQKFIESDPKAAGLKEEPETSETSIAYIIVIVSAVLIPLIAFYIYAAKEHKKHEAWLEANPEERRKLEKHWETKDFEDAPKNRKERREVERRRNRKLK